MLKDTKDFIISEARLNLVHENSQELKNIINDISSELNQGKKVITVVMGQLVEISKDGNKINIEPLP